MVMTSNSTNRPLAAATEDHRSKDKARAVLNAASKVFLSHGFSAATTDMIQREAAVSKSTVYAHYPNKEALFIAVIEDRCHLFAEVLNRIQFEPGNLRRTLMALGVAYLGFLLSPDGLALFRVVIAEAPRFPQLAERFYHVGPRAIAGRVGEQLALAVKAGEVDLSAIGLDTAAGMLTGLIRSEAQLHYLTHPEARPSAEQVERWVASAVTTFILAFGHADGG
jgi:AcrR family transcriptional regulator